MFVNGLFSSLKIELGVLFVFDDLLRHSFFFSIIISSDLRLLQINCGRRKFLEPADPLKSFGKTGRSADCAKLLDSEGFGLAGHLLGDWVKNDFSVGFDRTTVASTELRALAAVHVCY